MRTLDEARQVCQTHLPGLLAALGQYSTAELERPGNPAIRLFREHRGPSLVIPKDYAGQGITPSEAIKVTRAIGACAPSLSVASTMHHFSVATMFTLAESLRSSGMEWALLEAIADQNLLVGSGFAEGKPGQGILTPNVTGERVPGGLIVNGSKKPCSLSASMDLLSASVSVPDADGKPQLMLLLIPIEEAGVSVHRFWRSDVLAGAESEEVRLTDVFVNETLMTPAEVGQHGELDQLQTVGFMWFEMLITACYLGMASALVERVFAKTGVSADVRASIGIRLETAALHLEHIALLLEDKQTGNRALSTAMIARHGAQDAIVDASVAAVEALGGVSFISSAEVGYLAAACNCVKFHPPSRAAVRAGLDSYFAGDLLRFD